MFPLLISVLILAALLFRREMRVLAIVFALFMLYTIAHFYGGFQEWSAAHPDQQTVGGHFDPAKQ